MEAAPETHSHVKNVLEGKTVPCRLDGGLRETLNYEDPLKPLPLPDIIGYVKKLIHLLFQSTLLKSI